MIRKLALAAITAAVLFPAQAPAPADAYTWGPWSAWSYRSVTADECAKGRTSDAGKANKWPQCRIATRARKALVTNTAYWDTGTAQLESVALFSLYRVTANANYRYNGRNVYTDGQVSCSGYGLGYTLDVKWCGTDNEGGRNINYLRFGFDYQVSFLWEGSALSARHWGRARIYVDGSRTCCEGG